MSQCSQLIERHKINRGREWWRNRKVKRWKGGRSRKRQAALVWVITLCTWLVSVGYFWAGRKVGEKVVFILSHIVVREWLGVKEGQKQREKGGGGWAPWQRALSLTSPTLWTTCQWRCWSGHILSILSHLCTNPLKKLADLPVALYCRSNGKTHALCLGEFIKFIGLTCYF